MSSDKGMDSETMKCKFRVGDSVAVLTGANRWSQAAIVQPFTRRYLSGVSHMPGLDNGMLTLHNQPASALVCYHLPPPAPWMANLQGLDLFIF